MARITTDILCNNQDFLRDTAILIHDWETHIAGRFHYPQNYGWVELNLPYAIRIDEQRTVRIKIDAFAPHDDSVEIRFTTTEPVAFLDFLHLEDTSDTISASAS